MACAAHDVFAQINRISTMRGSTSRVACASRSSGLRVATTGWRRGAWQQSLGQQPTWRAMPEGANDRQSTAMGLDPNLELEVPKDQRPVNELAQLRGANLYSWATLDLSTYIRNLSVIFAITFAVVSGPISYQTFDPFRQPLEWMLASSVGSLLVVSLAALRIYLGWSYVSDRLLSASVEYEETGWYDGQVFVKPPEVLARDRLLGVYEVKPALGRVKRTLVGSSLLLLSCFIALSILIRVGADTDNVYGRGAAVKPKAVTESGIIYSKSVASLSQLKLDDDLAAEEALAQGGRPGYCADRYYRAAAGGQYCSKFD